MHGGGAGTGADAVADGDALFAVIRRDSDLDQFVRGQRPVDFTDQAVGQTGAADLHDGLERVGAGLQVGALAGGQWLGHESILVSLLLHHRPADPRERIASGTRCAVNEQPGFATRVFRGFLRIRTRAKRAYYGIP